MTILDILRNVWLLLQNSWRPALEITILAVGIYYALIFVRGTRGWPIVVGFLLVLLVLTVVTTALDLRVLLWLLTKFLTGLAIAVLVIFQPELRRMLAELGNLQLFTSATETHQAKPDGFKAGGGNLPLFTSATETRQNIEVIIQTAERLSEVKIGALIAIEQSIQLAEVVESGVAVDCQATPEMLETMFFPNNAIHDGGVIIRGDRIAKAACIFPLTRRQDLNPSLGTRHRAAIGLSEETDAVVVVVSEETGVISYAYKGQLVRGLSLEHLRAFLTTVFVKDPKSQSLTEWLRTRRGFGWFHRPVASAKPGAPAAKAETRHQTG